MKGADLQWWHFAIALAIMLVFVAVFAWQSAAWQAERDRRIDGDKAAGLTEDEARYWRPVARTCRTGGLHSHPDTRAGEALPVSRALQG